jgi:hypothetical protein
MNAHAGAQAHFQDVSWNLLAARWFLAGRNGEDEKMGRYLLLWLLGVPIPLLILIWLLGGLN